MKNGLKTFDSDMHVYDPAFLYEKYMNPQWGERIPRGTAKRQAWPGGVFALAAEGDAARESLR